ncbi:MAG: type I DNA topoisomerase [Candidatus Omnitrophica bacterium]|nr:type I DNA topoisomerase [Candidatus Omnitrophota bacterium]
MKKTDKAAKKTLKKTDLVIVESPTKARTIHRILGDEFAVVSSMGHVIDLPAKRLGVDIEHGYVPEYEVIRGRQKVLDDLKKKVKNAAVVYVATDPDREGEAIGWHVAGRVAGKKKVVRVTFHEITPDAVKNSFKHPREFDANMVEAQLGRRVLDRIVGYFLSPLLWRKIGRGLSAGRVQSVALRLIVERERAIKQFIPREYWEIAALLQKPGEKRTFGAKLDKIDGKKAQIPGGEEAARLAEDIRPREFRVKQVKESQKRRNPDPPFITSTLQQEAFNKLRYNASKTMLIAQQLYEGIDLGGETTVGLITYMRTDSPRVSPEAVAQVRSHILKKYGREYLPDKPNQFRVKKLAQEAHEAIRPTLIDRPVESLEQYLGPEQYKLYKLIHARFIASQMVPARYKVTSVTIAAGAYQFTASGTTQVFAGCTAVYKKEEPAAGEKKERKELPLLQKDDVLVLEELKPSQHFTKPPARYSDSSLVKALEEEGIGRPSTYAPIISTLIMRDYARRIKGYFHGTELGEKVCDMLVEYFPLIMDVGFTASLEEKLDDIEGGQADKRVILDEFYGPFKERLEYAKEHIKKEVIQTDEICAECGKPMVVKWGRKGKFLSCSAFPACRFAKAITSGVPCPEENCDGELIERRSRRGVFYGCSRFPRCRFTSRNLPEPKTD